MSSNDGAFEFVLPKVDSKSTKWKGMKPFNSHLPQLPFFVGIIGPRHSGKTVLLYNLLSKNPGMYGASFKASNIVLYSPTADKDPTLKQLKLENVYGPPTDLQWLCDEITKSQKQYSESDSQAPVLLVLDDATQIKRGWIPIENQAYYGRHDDIHNLYVCHKMSSIPRGVRTQTQQWILYCPHEESERQWIMDMFSRRTTRELWERALLRAWREKFSFVYIDFEESTLDRIYRQGFFNPLFTQEEMNILLGIAGPDVFYDPIQESKPQVEIDDDSDSEEHKKQ